MTGNLHTVQKPQQGPHQQGFIQFLYELVSNPYFLYIKTPMNDDVNVSYCRGEEAVDQQSGHVTALEGELVTLSCNVTTSSNTFPDLFWYIQLTRDSPQYVLRRDCYSEWSNRMVSGASLTPDKEDYTPTERSSVTLSCSYETERDDILLYLYRHYSKQAPQFLLYKGARSSNGVDHIPDKRYTSKTSQTSTELVIKRLTLADTALYYCASGTCIGDHVQQQPGGGSHGNDITPTTDKVFGLKDDVMKLSCNYSSASNLQWYRQYPGSSPIFLLLTGVSSNPSVLSAIPPYPRLSIKLNKERTRVDLEISSSEVTHSSLYYCTLQVTVTGNPETLYKYLKAHDTLLAEVGLPTVGGSFQQTIQPNQHEVYGEEGSNVQFSCNYSSSYSLSSEQVLTPYTDVEVASERDRVTLSSFLGNRFGDSINRATTEELVQEGRNVHLSCKYDAIVYNLQWYRQYPRSKPKFILYITPEGTIFKTTPPHPRLTVSIDKMDKSYISVFYSSPTHLTVGMEPWLRNLLILAACCYGDVIATEGEQVTLGCQFDAVNTNDLYLFWYKHEVNSFPKFMLGRFSFGKCRGADSVTQSKREVTAYEGEYMSLSCEYNTKLITGDHITPVKPRVICTEGESVTLSCSYDTSSDNILLYWYQQYPNQAPQFLMVKLPYKVPVNIPLIVHINPQRITSELVTKHLTLADTALYYCAFGKDRKFSAGDSCGDGIYSNSLEKDVIHGGSVKLSCNYTVSGGGSVLWYHQYPTSAPQFFLLISVDRTWHGGKQCYTVLQLLWLSRKYSMVSVISQISTPIPPVHYNLLKTLCTSIEDIVTPDRDVVDVMEGGSDRFLGITQKSEISTEGKPAPQFLLNKGARSIHWEHIPDKRHTSKTSQSSTELVITSLTLADTALYYCALRDCYDQYCYTQ
ncbi:unnamed protein product [Coregonus sp. 'balchen']|nr:unnamed protein product [Coregonus sp. 'balchen']